MAIHLSTPSPSLRTNLTIPGSKSETNRLLILRALFSNLTIERPSTSDDSLVLKRGLTSSDRVVDIGHAGTAMRFLTAYFACGTEEKILTGSVRMQSRPLKILVDALRELGARITYLQKDGYPPLLIKGCPLTGTRVTMNAAVSSQYISALLLIAPTLPHGLTLNLQGEILSLPYVKMTLNLLEAIGIQTEFEEKTIRVFPSPGIASHTLSVESDWSSASYFYSMAALAKDADIRLSTYHSSSRQGDAAVADFYQQLGVNTRYNNNQIRLQKQQDFSLPKSFSAHLSAYPDLAQTLAVSCLGLHIPCRLTGLKNLKIKETNRLLALKNELSKFNARVSINEDSLELEPPAVLPDPEGAVKTYQDHRMAMAFAPLALKTPLSIANPEVVTKSFPGFWERLQDCGFRCEQVP